MNIEQRALFNSLRINWLLNPNTQVQPWQVEDYRLLSHEELFDRLRQKDMALDKVSLLALAQDVDSPEELCEGLVADLNLEASEQDQIYLVVFELWRRFVNEKPCLSIFCDELDHQIFAYDQGKCAYPADIQDAMANLEMILGKHADEGADPLKIFESVSQGCAHDLETFLYDYIAEQIDGHHYPYAADLLESFGPYCKDVAWFDFLRARLFYHSDPENSDKMILHIIQSIKKAQDLDLSLEVLTFLSNGGNPELFRLLVRQTFPMLETEEDFQELLTICADYYHLLDQEQEEQKIQKILKQRAAHALENPIHLKDTKLIELVKMFK
jgi:hypothetical protein